MRSLFSLLRIGYNHACAKRMIMLTLRVRCMHACCCFYLVKKKKHKMKRFFFFLACASNLMFDAPTNKNVVFISQLVRTRLLHLFNFFTLIRKKAVKAPQGVCGALLRIG